MMKSRNLKSCYRLTLFIAVLVFVASCTTYADKLSTEADEPPPDSSAADPAVSDVMETPFERDNYHQLLLREDMRAMTISVRKLLVLDSQTEISAEERHKQVIRELDNLQGTATMIDEDGGFTGYSLLSPYLGSFLHDVSMAREFAERSPPDYQPATWLIKSCLFCHGNI